MTFTFYDVNGLNGGLSFGFVKAGFEMRARAGYFGLGRHIVNANAHLWGPKWDDMIMESMGSDDWETWPMGGGKVDAVVGVPPCAGFSNLTGKGYAASGAKPGPLHPANQCMWATVRYAARLHPRVVMFESVTGAYRQGRELMQMLRSELERITGVDYTLSHWLHDGAVLGAPTSRQRYLFVATRPGN